ncbi:MAG: hypothetical protein HY895_10050 [Deltaproteobacteria bacterium]|nr:hypothetical protein [Deltaproteobacteria bacterium]
MERKKRRKPEAVQRRNIIGEKLPADSKISGARVLSIDEILTIQPLLMIPRSPWARTSAGTTGNVRCDELATIKLTDFSQIVPTHIHSRSTAAIAAFSKLGR